MTVLDDSPERARRIAAHLHDDRQIADAARAYCAALQANADAEPIDWLARLAALDDALHELQIACGYENAASPS